MAQTSLDIVGARKTLSQHRAAHALVRDVVKWVELAPPAPAETPSGAESIERWRAGLVERLDYLQGAVKAHLEYEETTDLFVPGHPAFRRFETKIVHLKAEHPFLLAALERLRLEAKPQLVRALAEDTRELLEIYERHERTENEILAEVYGFTEEEIET